jgi:hypothetical protein
VIAVFEGRADPNPSGVIWLEWREGGSSLIRDYRYVGMSPPMQSCRWRRRPNPGTTAAQ